MVINLRNYVLCVFPSRFAHQGSINETLVECDPGPTYDVQRLWVLKIPILGYS